ncbi:Acetyltransferase (GNAT) family protein [compost metagenome]
MPEWRGRGVGRQLLVHLARLAVERDCGRMEWAVLDWNEPAIGFYRRVGARVLDDWRICRLTGPALTALAERNLV